MPEELKLGDIVNLERLHGLGDALGEHGLRDELAALAFFDRQSGLPNSQKLMQDLEGAEAPLLVCYDVRALRGINEAYGRTAGDLTLQAVSEWVQAQNFGNAGLYRVGGDEYALLFFAADIEKAQAAAGEIMERFTEAWALTLHGQQLHMLCGVSVAVVTVPAGGAGDELINRMERALDAARKCGEVVVYDRAMDDAYDARLRLETALRGCVENEMEGFEVHFQPIVDPGAGTWQGLEALCRWTDPETGESIPPLVFIREAEQLGLIRQVGMFVLETAIKTAKKYRLDAVENFFLSVNVSPIQLLDEQFGGKVATVLEKHGYPGDCLVLEVTESLEFTFSAYSMEIIGGLRALGVRFSLDDFGTGYSSFNNLKNLPVSTLKTERAFTADIEDDNYLQYFFYTMAELAHAAGMRLLAEGVETPKQLDILLKNGADLLQGYLFSKPLTGAELAAHLDDFTQVAPVFYEVRKDAAAQQIFSGREGWLSSPKLLQLLNRSMQVLLSHENLAGAIGEVLELTGHYFRVSRSYMFEKQGGRFSNTHEWCAPGVQPQKCYLRNLEPAALGGWMATMEGGGMVVEADLTRMGADVRHALYGVDIKSIVLVPLFDGAELMGIMGYESRDFRSWLPEEVSLIRNLCMTTAGCLKRERLQTEVRETDLRFTDVLNHIDLGIMVTDPATDEVVWANEGQSRMFQVAGELVGRRCYEGLYGRTERCPNCEVRALLENPGVELRAHEHFNERTGRWMMVNDSLVQWAGGRQVHLQYAVDITEVKQAQKKLEYYANTDAMTGAYNRSSLIAAMQEMLRRADAEGTPMSVVFIDIDKLKYANDTFGHSFGDELIKGTVQAVRERVRSSDVMGRYGGDEFIVLLERCPAEQAAQRIEMARSKVRQAHHERGHVDFGFSYGVVENTELPYEDSDRLLNAIINLADDRMRDHKKTERAKAGEALPEDERLAGLSQGLGDLLG
ncbi:EAL domain-containing protein [Ruminococcaceae bacterium OttesenSCG-928-A11]|nr:EAL domain-containing protein [Ruminococcaceae bacterium OttesenSCG-928-A11]